MQAFFESTTYANNTHHRQESSSGRSSTPGGHWFGKLEDIRVKPIGTHPSASTKVFCQIEYHTLLLLTHLKPKDFT